ncbi:MAG: TetR/AcrR family transcriptional regulator [Desulfobacterales bacterium]|nr:TetR/AcrR family transcriptional regulator [Desulfobacterales bacterium]
MKTLDKSHWIQQGFRILTQSGAAGLTIENLTRALKRTKGSFYHHFKNRDEFLRALLGQWEESQALEIIRHSRKEKTFDTINQALVTLSGQAMAPEIEVAVRAWAHRDPLAREFQERIDARRVAFLEKLFFLITEDQTQAARFARIRYCFYIGTHQMIPPMDPLTYEEQLDSLTRMFKREIASSTHSH